MVRGIHRAYQGDQLFVGGLRPSYLILYISCAYPGEQGGKGKLVKIPPGEIEVVAVFWTQIQVSLVNGEQVERVGHRIKLIDRRHVDMGTVTYIDSSARPVFVFVIESGLKIEIVGVVHTASVQHLIKLVPGSFQDKLYLGFIGIAFPGEHRPYR